MLIWTCPTIQEWDRFVCDRTAADGETLAQHLAVCPLCRLTVQERRNELITVAEVWEGAKLPRVINLSYWTAAPLPDSASIHLAAQGDEESTLPQSVTLASPDQRLLLRAVKDRNTGETWLYLLSDDASFCHNVLVRPFSLNREFLTDGEGRVNLGEIEWPAQTMLTAEVRCPMATFTLTPARYLDADESAIVLNSPDGDQIRVTLSEYGRNKRVEIEVLKLGKVISGVPLKVAVREGQGSGIVLVSSESSGQVTVGEVKALEPIEIFLFQ
jgi:hypothetical protein